MNVALTRAKFVLIVIGNGNTLSSNEIWNKLLNHMIQSGNYYKLSNEEILESFVESMFRNTEDIPNIYRRTNLIHHIRTLKKIKLTETTSKTTLFEKNFSKKKLKHNNCEVKNETTNIMIIEDDSKEEEEKEEDKYTRRRNDILAQEDHSYLFKKNEKKSNLMCLISKNTENVEEARENSGFNIFKIANIIKK